MRPSQRKTDEMRKLTVVHKFTKYAEGSVLVSFGDTKVLCNASVLEEVPGFLKDANQGWLTAEYGMLPRSTHLRMDREAVRGKQSGRTQEIQRLIGRALRSAVNLSEFPGITIKVDCDVLQADGGTRSAAITGGSLAIEDAVHYMQANGLIKDGAKPIKAHVAAISVGVYKEHPVVDLDYAEDSNADVDMNIVMTQDSHIVEIQGTAEGKPFLENDFTQMLVLGKKSINEIFQQTRHFP